MGSLLRQGWSLVRQNRRRTLLPLAVTMLPVTCLTAVAEFILLNNVYTDVPYDSVTAVVEDAPAKLTATMLGVASISALFTLVGFAATIIAVQGLVAARTRSLAESLDPAFTRMGGILLLGGLAFALWSLTTILAVTVLGALFVLYCMARLALSLHAFILEAQPVRVALRTSWALLHRNVIRLIGLTVATAVASFVAGLVAFIVLAIVSAPFTPSDPGRTATLAVGAVGVVVAGTVMIPVAAWFAATTTLFYLELKARSNV